MPRASSPSRLACPDCSARSSAFVADRLSSPYFARSFGSFAYICHHDVGGKSNAWLSLKKTLKPWLSSHSFLLWSSDDRRGRGLSGPNRRVHPKITPSPTCSI